MSTSTFILRCASAIAIIGNSFGAYAQDTLFYTNGSFVTGTVEEVGVEQVRYATQNAGNNVLVYAPTKDLRSVKLASGQTIQLSANTVLAAAGEQHKHAVKLDVIAPALNHLVIGYEHVIGTRTNLEVKVGLIGLGQYGDYREYRGGMAKVGVKFILPPRRERPEHPLAGFYLRPEILLTAWSSRDQYYLYYSYPSQNMSVRNEYRSAAINLAIGRQWMLGSRWLFDIYGGLGYGAQWHRTDLSSGGGYDGTYTAESYAFSHLHIGSRSPLIMSAGLLFGYAF